MRKKGKQRNKKAENNRKLKNKLNMRKKRDKITYLKEERARDKQRKKTLRQDEQFMAAERDRDLKRKSKQRQDERFRDEERIKNQERIQILRQNEQFVVKERSSDQKRKRESRQDTHILEKERNSDRQRKQIMRQNEDFRNKEKAIDLEARTTSRENNFIKYRENVYNNLIRANLLSAKCELKFIKQRSELPTYVCMCCEGLFFIHSVQKFEAQSLIGNAHELYNLVVNVSSEYVCLTCRKYILKHQIPKLATSNHLKFPYIPDCIETLSPLEERMVAPYINFMQIRPLKSYALNAQLGQKGSVVNVPIDLNRILNVLPRSFDQMQTIQVKLKRHMEHKSDYMFETIRPAVVCEALQFWIDTPLYKKHEIQIDQRYLSMNETNDQQLPFIIENEDDDIDQQFSQLGLRATDIAELFSSSYNSNEDQTDDLNLEEDEEVLIINNNPCGVENDQIRITAPAQNNVPVPWHLIEDLEELSFPKMFVGQSFNDTISYNDRAKSEARRKDRRSCVPTRVLYMAKKKLEKACLASINVCLRKTRNNNSVAAGDALKKEFVDNLVKFDDGFRFLKQIRSSPSYWEAKKKELLAMIRQFGKPTIFLTISAGEQIWPELIQALYKLRYNKNLTLLEAYELEKHEKTKLIQADPVTCARYFDYKAFKFMNMLKENDSIFQEHKVEDSYSRVEFQMRGSPHEHIFLWLKDAPPYNKDDAESIERCVAFIDKFITCQYDENNPYVALQKHKHSHTCYKGQRVKKCRFNYPIPAMPRTMILEPLSPEQVTDDLKSVFRDIKNYMQYLYTKQVDMTFDDILAKLSINEDKYIMAIRSSLKRTHVFLKRSSLEVGINCYNKQVQYLFESNMDIQFVLDPYAAASYIVNYVAKIESGLSKLLRDAAADVEAGNNSLRDKFKRIANVFLNANLMSAQEAAYHVLSLPLSKMSRKCVYINTSPANERVLMLKSEKELAKLDKDSNDVYVTGAIQKYSNRPRTTDNVCLADFIAEYKKGSGDTKNENEDEDRSDANVYRSRLKPAIIRYRRYKLMQDAHNYYREQIMLFLPWRNETAELESVNCANKYLQYIDTITQHRIKYSIMGDDELDNALEQARQADADATLEETDEEAFCDVDLFQQGGMDTSKNKMPPDSLYQLE